MTTAPFSASGNQMVAEAFRQAEPDVMAAYPITPQTTIVEQYAKFVADGRVHTEFVTVESEHSAMSACIGASSAGARVATATSSQGLAFMWEELYVAAGMRTPIVMANANRALSAPINIHGDQSDIMGARDAGWVMLFAETAQEAYDNSVIAFRIAEEAKLPTITALDGFVTTHAMERVVMEDDDVAHAFIGEYTPEYALLDTEHPTSHGMFANLGNMYMRERLALRRALEAASPIIDKHGKAWAEITGREFNQVDCWETEDADYIVVVLGSCAGNARHVARELRANGKKVGVVKPRVFRPFPGEQIAQACRNAKAVAVLDRSDSFGAEQGPVASEVTTAFYNHGVTAPVNNYIVGLGGADITVEQIKQVFDEMEQRADGSYDGTLRYLGIEE